MISCYAKWGARYILIRQVTGDPHNYALVRELTQRLRLTSFVRQQDHPEHRLQAWHVAPLKPITGSNGYCALLMLIEGLE
jgi:hypothetical protein